MLTLCIFLGTHCIWEEYRWLLKDSKILEIAGFHSWKTCTPLSECKYKVWTFFISKLCVLIVDFISSSLHAWSSQVSDYILKPRWLHLDFITKPLLNCVKYVKTLRKWPKEKWTSLENFIFLLEDVIKGIKISNRYVIYLKLIQYCMSTIAQLKKNRDLR